MKYSRFDFSGYNSYWNGFSSLSDWDFASMLGYVDINGTWDLELHVNRPDLSLAEKSETVQVHFTLEGEG